MNALSQMIDATVPGGLILDLQVIRPDPTHIRLERHVEQVTSEQEFCFAADGEPLFAWADAATAAVEARIAAGDLVEEAVDDHDVRKHYTDGADLVDDFDASRRNLPEEMLPMLTRIEQPLVLRERCRLRALRVGRNAARQVELTLEASTS